MREAITPVLRVFAAAALMVVIAILARSPATAGDAAAHQPERYLRGRAIRYRGARGLERWPRPVRARARWLAGLAPELAPSRAGLRARRLELSHPGLPGRPLHRRHASAVRSVRPRGTPPALSHHPRAVHGRTRGECLARTLPRPLSKGAN